MNSIPTQEQYEKAESIRLHEKLQAIEKQSLADRKESKAELTCMLNKDLEFIFQCLEYLCNGDYGHAALSRIKKMTKRMNRRAGIFILLAAMEFRCPSKMACDVWNGLDTDLQAAINVEIDRLLAEKIDGVK